MAYFDVANEFGQGFDMSSTSDSGFAVVGSDPSITQELIYDQNGQAIWNVYGSSLIDGFGINYSSDGTNFIVHDIIYFRGGTVVITIGGVDIYTTASDLQSGAWAVRLNAQSDQFYGNDYNDIIRGGFGNDLIVGYAGNDTLLGDEGNDTLGGGGGNDVIVGGDGYDTASFGGLSTNYIFTRNGDGSVTVTDNTGGWGTDVVYSVEAFYFDNGTFSLLSLLPPDVIINPNTGDDGSNTITGDTGNNVLRGLGGNDLIQGGAGDDLIYGGLGNDRLYGNVGKDRFVFDTKPNNKTNKDTIYDFNVKDDTICIDNFVFTKVGKNGILKSSAFWSSTSGKAHDSNDRIVYDKDGGQLYYDADGSGKGAAIQIAQLSKKLAMTYNDFFVI